VAGYQGRSLGLLLAAAATEVDLFPLVPQGRKTYKSSLAIPHRREFPGDKPQMHRDILRIAYPVFPAARVAASGKLEKNRPGKTGHARQVIPCGPASSQAFTRIFGDPK
jgi:hypothetical protein